MDKELEMDNIVDREYMCATLCKMSVHYLGLAAVSAQVDGPERSEGAQFTGPGPGSIQGLKRLDFPIADHLTSFHEATE